MKQEIRFLIFWSVLIFTLTQCKTQQFNVGSSRNGKCYAKCLYQDKIITEKEEFIVYTGNPNEEEVDLIEKEIIIRPASTKWVKKKADKNCLSSDPDDCLVWCLVDEEPIVRVVSILADTTKTKNFKKEVIEREVNRIPGRSFEWKEVVCEQNISKELIKRIQQALASNQHYIGGIHGEFDSMTRKSLLAFQEKNALPIGQLDFETLDVLGIVLEGAL